MNLNRPCQSTRWSLLLGLLLASNVVAPTLAAVGRHPDDAPFLAANNVAMSEMMAGMAVRPTGDVDADFVNMMEPHHRGGIAMAEIELRYGRNEQLRRIAQEIIVDQQQEIVAMRLALGRPLPLPASAPTQGTGSSGARMSATDMDPNSRTTPKEHGR